MTPPPPPPVAVSSPFASRFFYRCPPLFPHPSSWGSISLLRRKKYGSFFCLQPTPWILPLPFLPSPTGQSVKPNPLFSLFTVPPLPPLSPQGPPPKAPHFPPLMFSSITVQHLSDVFTTFSRTQTLRCPLCAFPSRLYSFTRPPPLFPIAGTLFFPFYEGPAFCHPQFCTVWSFPLFCCDSSFFLCFFIQKRLDYLARCRSTNITIKKSFCFPHFF